MSSSTGADRRCGTSGGATQFSIRKLFGKFSCVRVTCQSNELSLMVVVVQTSKYRFQLNKEIRRKESLQTYDMPGLKTEFSAALDP
ncbi:hypothetical protein U9M48_002787 [Paspalum notatum var. saurae]|uniref:Uncharacterized protein n=1 Tax=Paspalum notatum var. saurae TaxID=547442 RepID=A0AAQ3PGI0_PASNO